MAFDAKQCAKRPGLSSNLSTSTAASFAKAKLSAVQNQFSVKRPPSESTLNHLPCRSNVKSRHWKESHNTNDNMKNYVVFYNSSAVLAPFT